MAKKSRFDAQARGWASSYRTKLAIALETALLMARQIIDGKAPDLSIGAAKIVGTLSSARQACNAADPYESARKRHGFLRASRSFEMQDTDTNEPFRKPLSRAR
jgi:hypothetical protein